MKDLRTFTIFCSDGELVADFQTGKVMENTSDYSNFVSFDVPEYQAWRRSIGQPMLEAGDSVDVLLIGIIDDSGNVVPADSDARADFIYCLN